MGAFLAGVLLSESAFRHQLEADIEPFRGILLGLFFLGAGMAIDLSVIAANWQVVVISVLAYMALKGVLIYAVARLLRACHSESLERAVLMAQGGEFAFVLYAAAVSAGIIDAEANATLTATIILSMMLTPIAIFIHGRLAKPEPPKTDDLEVPENVEGTVLMIGFGRFGQIVSQPLLARGYKLSLIDKDADFVRDASNFGFRSFTAMDPAAISCTRQAQPPQGQSSSASTTRRRRSRSPTPPRRSFRWCPCWRARSTAVMPSTSCTPGWTSRSARRSNRRSLLALKC